MDTRTILMLASMYVATKTVNKGLKLGLGAFLVYSLYKVAKENAGTLNGNADGWKMNFDTNMAIDSFLPGLNPIAKTALGLAANSMLNKYGINGGASL